MISKQNNLVVFFTIFMLSANASIGKDFTIDGMYNAAIGIPSIMFLVKTDANSPFPDHIYDPDLEYYIPQFAYLDTGASGVLFSKETAIDILGLNLEAGATFVDVGVSGDEFFDVSEQIYIGTEDLLTEDLNNKNLYITHGPWRVQVKQNYVEELFDSPYDIIGVPAMAGKIVVLNAWRTNQGDYFSADIKDLNEPNIPVCDITVPLRMGKYIFPEDSRNIPPYPILAYNPVIDNVKAIYNDKSISGTYLLDTGAQISIISVAQGMEFGLVDANGEPVQTPDFFAAVTGVGGIIELPGYIIDQLRVPTLQGYDIVYNNAYFVVHDIGIYDYDIDDFVILDGIFGSSFISATMYFDANDPLGIFETAGTPFDWVVIDFNNYTLGFDVNDVYPVPKDSYSIAELANVSNNWLSTDCNLSNGYCNGGDINLDGTVNFNDHAELASFWYNSRSYYVCGNQGNPWPRGDVNRDCVIDISDIYVYARQWLAQCDVYNANCQFADVNKDGTVNFVDWPN